MNFEFHYYINKYIAIKAGFDKDEAEIIAHSSQFVNNNLKRFKIKINALDYFENYISQTKDPLKPTNKLLRIYTLFHCFPGIPNYHKARRKDGKMHMLNCTPASQHIESLMANVLHQENLFLIGIASHAYADTFAYQNFIGLMDSMNSMQGIVDKVIPSIGKADAGISPDIPNLVWEDERLISENQKINNKIRYIQAAKRLYENYLILTSFENNWIEIEEELSYLIGDEITDISDYEEEKEERITRYLNVLEQKEKYDPNKWLQEVVEEDVVLFDENYQPAENFPDKLTFIKGFRKKNWYKFQSAIKEYQFLATETIDYVLKQLEIHNW